MENLLIGYVPEKVKKMKTNKEIIAYFLFFYDFCIVYSYSPQEIEQLEKTLTDEFNLVIKGHRFSNEKKWWLLVAILMKHFYQNKKGAFLASQTLSNIIDNAHRVTEETFSIEIADIDSVVRLHHYEAFLSPRPSMLSPEIELDEPILDLFIKNREEILATFKALIPKKKINVSSIESYLKFTPLKNMEFVYYSLFDILYGFLDETSNRYQWGDNIGNDAVISIVCESLLKFFNLFILDVKLVREISEEVTNIIFSQN